MAKIMGCQGNDSIISPIDQRQLYVINAKKFWNHAHKQTHVRHTKIEISFKHTKPSIHFTRKNNKLFANKWILAHCKQM